MWSVLYQPQDLSECKTLSNNALMTLHSYVEDQLLTLPHFLFHGQSGSGKRTIIQAFLRSLNQGSELKLEPAKLKNTEIHILKSKIHIELSAFAVIGQSQQDILMQILDEVGKNASFDSGLPFQIVWIKDITCFNHTTQKQLGVLMEKSYYNLRFIFTCEDGISRLLPSFRSRCSMMRIASPSNLLIHNILMEIVNERNMSITQYLLKQVVNYSQRNLQTAISILQSSIVSGTLFIPEWKNDLLTSCAKFMKSPNSESVTELKDKCQEWLSYELSGSMLIKELMNRFLRFPDLGDLKKHMISNKAQHFEARLKLGHTPLIHLEAFICVAGAIFTTSDKDFNQEKQQQQQQEYKQECFAVGEQKTEEEVDLDTYKEQTTEEYLEAYFRSSLPVLHVPQTK